MRFRVLSSFLSAAPLFNFAGRGVQLGAEYSPDESCELGLQMGADGAIGMTYNSIPPRTYVKLHNAVQSCDIAETLCLQHKANWLIRLYMKYNVIAAAKAALELQSYDVGETNRPMTRMSLEEKHEFWGVPKAEDFSQKY